MNPAQPFIDACMEETDRLAIVELGGRSITHGQLVQRVFGLAEHLRANGVQKGDHVLIQIPPGIDLSLAILAVLWCGGVVVLLEGGVGDDVYLQRVQQLNPTWLLIHSKLVWIHRLWGVRSLLSKMEVDVPPFPKSDTTSTMILSAAELQFEQESSDPVELDEQDDALIVFTGGTTNAPKCVRYGCEALQHFLHHIHLVLGERPINSFLADTPPQVLYAIKMGYTAYVNKGRKLKRAINMLKLIESGKIDACFTSPYLWIELLKSKQITRLPDSLHTIMLGSAPVTKDFLRTLKIITAPNTQILCIYGMTEVGAISVVEATDKINWTGNGDLVGESLHPLTVHLKKDSTDSPMGEIVVHSPSLYTGYWGREPRNQLDGLKTGDLGRWVTIESKEMLVLEGRLKDMIIRNGFNIYPQTFEHQLTEHFNSKSKTTLVYQTALIGVWNTEKSDEDVVLFVEWAASHKKPSAWFLSEAKTVCGHQVAPDYFFGLEQFPVTGRQNKLDKKSLRHQAMDLLGRVDTLPSSSTQ